MKVNVFSQPSVYIALPNVLNTFRTLKKFWHLNKGLKLMGIQKTAASNAKPVAVIYATNYLKESKIFTSSSTVTGKTYSINSNLNCNSSSVIYLITCNLCTLQYVGSTNTPFKVGFHNHKLAMKTHKRTCEVAIHFNNSQGNTIYPTWNLLS